VNAKSTLFQRYLLPGLAFKAVVIGGGYATGRELVTFFLPSGARGGLLAMLLAMGIWSGIGSMTFVFALQTGSRDYRTFFSHLLGPFWPVFEVSYFLALMVVLAVFAAAAAAIGEALFGWPPVCGALCLMVAITLVATWGNDAVERLFKYVSFFLYGTYVVFVALSLVHSGDRVIGAFAHSAPTTGWMTGGLTYAGYNILGAVVILPVLRHLTRRRDAVIAGILAGPLAMIPAMLFFICMVAYGPEVQSQTLPSDYMLAQLGLPIFRWVFHGMIFAALLESGTGGVHAINERIAQTYLGRTGRSLSSGARLGITLLILTVSMFVAARFGLVALIARGLRWLSYLILTIYVLPLLLHGVYRLIWIRSSPPLRAAVPEKSS